MSILAEKSIDRPVINKYETLFHRHPSNPILTGKDWPYSMNSVFNAGATLLPDGSTLLLCRVEDRRGLSHLCVARSANGVDGWQIDREPTFIPDVERFPEVMGRRRSAHHVYAGTPAICGGLHFVFAWRSRSVSGTHERFSRIRETRCRHVAGRQRCGPFAEKN